MALINKYTLLSVLVLILSGIGLNAQTIQKSSIDTDIRDLRNIVMPDFSCSVDDYLQYSPAVVMLGLKACGYEGRTQWGRMLVSDAFSVVGMAAAVKGLKIVVDRQRPDGSDFDSFPSGHTAKAFMGATMLHKEYGWRSPWFSIGGYTVAAMTGVSRLMNNKHWMSDVVTGAAIGIGSVHLGYFITDKIFKDKGLYDGYEKPEFLYDFTEKHYVAELLFGRRFMIGGSDLPERGSIAGISTDIPVIPGIGVTVRATAGSMVWDSENVSERYDLMAGGYWNYGFAKILEFQAKAMAGASFLQGSAGIGLSAGVGLSLITDNNFKIKAFADYETASCRGKSWMNSIVVGYSASWFW